MKKEELHKYVAEHPHVCIYCDLTLDLNSSIVY